MADENCMNTRLTSSGYISTGPAELYTVYIDGDTAADDVTFRDGGSGGTVIAIRGTDAAAAQKRQYSFKGLAFAKDIHATLGTNINAVECEYK